MNQSSGFATGIYESLITELLHDKLRSLESSFFIAQKPVDPAEAAIYLAHFLSHLLHSALESFPQSNDRVHQQIKLSNDLIQWLSNYLNNADLSENLLQSQGQILEALFSFENPVATDFREHIRKITPNTGLVQSELFTGSNVGLSLESEIKREILSADEICWLVSFIKWTGIRIFSDVLKEVTARGTRLRVITTSYMGATDQKAVDFLAGLPNTEVRLSYNTERERLHAKAYLFLRNSGFHTGYIGSSNLSRSALTNGLEWNLKITTQEIPHILDKFQNTFITYWDSPDFEAYTPGNREHQLRLKNALRTERIGDGPYEEQAFFFDISPHAYQKAILERLKVERERHFRFRNLVVAATGTGKTVISAFDYRRFSKGHSSARLLFVAHRKEILQQARQTYRAVLRAHAFGELWVGDQAPSKYDHLFVSVQMLQRHIAALPLSADYYDFIVIDEVHHIAASSYRPILEKFSPKVLLGLTATPERHDGTDIREDFDGTIAAELRLPEAINERHLCPFQYFGIDDPVDLSNVQWAKGRYMPAELSKLYTANDLRTAHILRNMEDILGNIHRIKALAFCVTQEHAHYMCKKFLLKGIASAVLTSQNSSERNQLREDLVQGRINVLFVVDIFNEGVDIPEIDTVLFLRPTESLTVFLQQLGRGLRLSEGKDCLTVLDFVGNAREEYDFSNKFRALVGKSHTSIADEIDNDFPHLPLGCSIVLQKQAKEIILRNIKNAIVNQRKLINYLRNYQHQTGLPLTLKNFLNQFPNVSVEDLYKNRIENGGGWSRLQIKAGHISSQLDELVERAMFRGISNRLLSCTSYSYLKFLHKLLESDGHWNQKDQVENQWAMMAHYDFWQKPGKEMGFQNLETSIKALCKDRVLKTECLEVLAYLMETLDIEEVPMSLRIPSALMVHARYSRDQILAAFGENNFLKKSSSREGVLEIKSLNIELLFVTLQKTTEKFSPTTLYHDYAINEYLFHWQSQNSARPDRGRGLTYVNQKKLGKQIILFVREQTHDQYGRVMGFVNIGPVNIESFERSQPMDVVWRLEEPLPPYLWKSAAKLAVGG